ncbi:hypothetical protein [Streptomyces sp. NPDC018947]|uniref:hypothetical protein n=1 Tax=Streptomyces sp. NPDC018947 TaxID=3365054 RepID=UPI0037BC196F
MTPPPARSRRADARRSRAAILDAATQVLNVEPDASLETIAKAAAVTRPAPRGFGHHLHSLVGLAWQTP